MIKLTNNPRFLHRRMHAKLSDLREFMSCLFSYWNFLFFFSHHFSFPPPTPHTPKARLFMTAVRSSFHFHSYIFNSFHFLFPLDVCTHFPHIFPIFLRRAAFIVWAFFVLLPTIKFHFFNAFSFLFVYLFRAFFFFTAPSLLCWEWGKLINFSLLNF